MSDANRTPADVTQTAHDDLIAEARTHVELPGGPRVNNGQGYCGNCSRNWPCATTRLADALFSVTDELAEAREAIDRDTRSGKDIDWWVEAAESAKESVDRITVSYLREKDRADAAVAAFEHRLARARLRFTNSVSPSSCHARTFSIRDILAAYDEGTNE